MQEFFHPPNQDKNPTFYVPAPASDSEAHLPLRSRSRQRQVNSLTFTPSQSAQYVKAHSEEWGPSPYEPPPDYDVEEKQTRRWSLASLKKTEKPRTAIEKIDIKIPKTKLNKSSDRARSQSPNWKKEYRRSVNDIDKGNLTNRAASSKSHYELGVPRRRESRQNIERAKVSVSVFHLS